MKRAITDYHQEHDGDWVAELACGHDQHVRHRPPFQERSWVLATSGREERLGTLLECPLCERAELPEGLQLVRSGPEWTEDTLPVGLRRAHRLAPGTWGTIAVHEGALQFSMASHPPFVVDLATRDVQPIPPEIDHEVSPLGRVRFSIDFLTVLRHHAVAEQSDQLTRLPLTEAEQGGDPACWAGLLCLECGVVLDGGDHRPDCPRPPTRYPLFLE
jgi:tellurite methyltransferase